MVGQSVPTNQNAIKFFPFRHLSLDITILPPMHIALVRRCYSLKKAGAERYCVNLSRQLQRLGHRVTIIGETIDPELRDQIEFLPVKVNHFASWTKNR